MSAYEIDGEDLSYLLTLLEERGTAQALDLRQRLAVQRPIPVPVKIGAMVKTHAEVVGERVFLKWAFDSVTHEPWIEAQNNEHTYRTEDIGRITEVLSPGCDA
jgi:hypothetical protein